MPHIYEAVKLRPPRRRRRFTDQTENSDMSVKPEVDCKSGLLFCEQNIHLPLSSGRRL